MSLKTRRPGGRPGASAVPAAGGLPPAVPTTSSGYPVVIWVLLGGNMLVRSAGFAYPFMGYRIAEVGQGAGVVGAVLAAFGLGRLAGQLVCGWLVDRVGQRWTLAVTMLVATVVLALMADADAVSALLVGAAVAGLVYDSPSLVLGTAIGELIPDPARRATIDACRYGWAKNVGAAITGGAGGLLADAIGISALYWINGMVCGIFGVVALCCLPSDARRPASAAKSSYRQAVTDRRLLLLVASGTATLTVFMGLVAAMPILMNARGLGVGAYGTTQLVHALAVIAFSPLITPLVRSRVAASPRTDILAAAGAAVTVAMAAAVFAHGTLGFSLSAAACAPGEIAYYVVAAGIVHRIAPSAQRGRYQGIWGTAMGAGSASAPILATSSLGHGGPVLVAITTLVVGLIGVATCLPLARVLTGCGASAART